MRGNSTKEQYLNGLIHGLFLEPADEDYLFARLAWKMGFVRQFHWSANQAIEKYLKCIFLLNGRNADFGHHWFEEFEKAVKDGFTPLISVPGKLRSPQAEPKPNSVSTLDLLRRLSKSGAPDIRYNEIPYNDIYYNDLLHLDEICCWFRCISVIDWTKRRPDEVLEPHKFSSVYLDKKIETEFRHDNRAFFPESATILEARLSFKMAEPEVTMKLARLKLCEQDVNWVLDEYVSRWNRSAKPKERQKMRAQLAKLGRQ